MEPKEALRKIVGKKTEKVAENVSAW